MKLEVLWADSPVEQALSSVSSWWISTVDSLGWSDMAIFAVSQSLTNMQAWPVLLSKLLKRASKDGVPLAHQGMPRLLHLQVGSFVIHQALFLSFSAFFCLAHYLDWFPQHRIQKGVKTFDPQLFKVRPSQHTHAY